MLARPDWVRGGFRRSYLAASDDDSRAWRDSFVSTFLERDVPQLGISIPAAAMRRCSRIRGGRSFLGVVRDRAAATRPASRGCMVLGRARGRRAGFAGHRRRPVDGIRDQVQRIPICFAQDSRLGGCAGGGSLVRGVPPRRSLTRSASGSRCSRYGDRDASRADRETSEAGEESIARASRFERSRAPHRPPHPPLLSHASTGRSSAVCASSSTQ